MTEAQAEINNREQENLISQMFDCYDVMVSLHNALYDQIREGGRRPNEQLSLRRVLKRFNAYKNHNEHLDEEGGDSKWLPFFRDQFGKESFVRLSVDDKKAMYKMLKNLIEEAKDVHLTKQVIVFLIERATSRTPVKFLPRIDYDSFEDVCRFVLEQPAVTTAQRQGGNDTVEPYINKASIDLLMRVLSERTPFTNFGEAV